MYRSNVQLLKETEIKITTRGLFVSTLSHVKLIAEIRVYTCHKNIGVRAGGARGAAAPPNFRQLRFFGQREKIWAKPVFKDVSILFNYFKDLNINLKSA